MTVNNFEKRIVNLEVTQIPDDLCWDTPKEFIGRLTDYLVGVIDSGSNEDFIIVSTQPPGPEYRNKIWAKFSINRNWLGWYGFIKGQWRKLYSHDTNDIIWKTGDSRNIEDGFMLIDGNTNILKESVRDKIISQYVESAVGSGIYNYFAVLFIGY